MLQKFQIAGFEGYNIFNNKTVTNPDGKAVKITKKGDFKMTATSVQDGVEVGTEYAFNIDQCVALGDDNWEDVTPAESFDISATDVQELTPEETKKKEIRDIKAKIAETSKAIVTKVIKSEDTSAESALIRELNEKLESYKTQPVEESEELKEARVELEKHATLVQGAKDALKLAQDAYNAQAEVIRGMGGKVKGASNGDHSARLTYEDAQNIRKDYAIGRYGNDGDKMAVSAIAEKYGVSQSAVNYCAKYLQHKLKKGDTAYTPLVNEFYPALGGVGNVTNTDGAPFVEDGVKEDRKVMYKIATNRVAAEAVTA